MAKQADYVFAEFYTSLMPSLNIENLEKLIGKSILILKRADLEEHAEKKVLNTIKGKKAVLLVPGDPMIATTHIDLRLRAEKTGIKTNVIPGASIFSAVCAATGLQAYKFGRTVTLPHIESSSPPASPYDHIGANLENGLHTLILLDLTTEKGYYMAIKEGLEYLQQIELNRKQNIIHDNKLIIGVARAGGDDVVARSGTVRELLKYDFGGPPHSLVMPSQLHFMEVEALQILTGAEPQTLRSYTSS